MSVKLSSSDEPMTHVELSVIANLRLEPSHVVILPGDLIQIDIYQVIDFYCNILFKYVCYYSILFRYKVKN